MHNISTRDKKTPFRILKLESDPKKRKYYLCHLSIGSFKLDWASFLIRYVNLSIHLRRKSLVFNFIYKFYRHGKSFSAKTFYWIPLSLRCWSFQLHCEPHLHNCCTLLEISDKMSFGYVALMQRKQKVRSMDAYCKP